MNEWLKTNERLRWWESKACSYQLVLLGYSLFEQCLSASLTFLIHQQGFGVPFGTCESIYVSPLQTCVELLVEKCDVGKQSPWASGWILDRSAPWWGCPTHLPKGHFTWSLVAFKNSLQWGKNLFKKKRGKKESKKANPPQIPTAVSLWGEGRVWFHCNYKDLYIWLWTSNPLLQEWPPPSQGSAANPQPSSPTRKSSLLSGS